MMEQNKVLEVKDLSMQFGGLKAVDSLNISINEGEIFGLIGPNGAGKTTVFNCITQFYKATSGTVLFRNHDGEVINLMDKQVHEIIGEGLVRTFQNVELIHELSVIDNVLIGAHVEFKTGLLHQFFNTKKAREEEDSNRQHALEILEFLEIDHLKDAKVGGLSYGILKKVELARTLISRPKLIILDEPAAGLNDTETIQFVETIRKIQKDLSCSILLVEHDMRFVMDVCDRITAISFGRHLATGTPEEIQNDLIVQEAYLGSVDDDE